VHHCPLSAILSECSIGDPLCLEHTDCVETPTRLIILYKILCPEWLFSNNTSPCWRIGFPMAMLQHRQLWGRTRCCNTDSWGEHAGASLLSDPLKHRSIPSPQESPIHLRMIREPPRWRHTRACCAFAPSLYSTSSVPSFSVCRGLTHSPAADNHLHPHFSH
jgi:hypothetical protein